MIHLLFCFLYSFQVPRVLQGYIFRGTFSDSRKAHAIFRCLSTLSFFDLRRLDLLDSLRRRGLDISSMPKLTNVSAAPKMEMHKPGGRTHHHAPSRRAE